MRRTPAIALLILPLLLSCALAPGAAVTAAPQDGGDAPDFDPIRFGDAEELDYAIDFFPGASYDPAIPTPDSILGQKHATRFSHHQEMLECFRRWAETSERVSVTTFGMTHEGRDLVYAAITSPENQARIDEIKAGHARLADPRGLSEAEGQRLLDTIPPVAWMAYSIHGDELSGTDAAVALGYHLAACTDEEVQQLLRDVVVVIDPCENPDGRERIISMVEQMAGYTPNLDYASMHRGRWPRGRGNHYLFDMNRDWGAGSQPETRARWRAVLSWNPQLFVDAHEMGGLDTFLFYPQNDPFLPILTETLIHWQRVFGDEQGLAFDEHGWSYYTREWADGWAPFYSDSFGSLIGAVGILYEQAGTKGFQLRRRSGEILTFREAVHHQVVASVANIETLQRHSEEVMSTYLAERRKNVADDTPGNDAVLAVRPDGNVDRLNFLKRVLVGQGIEYSVAGESFELSDVEGARGERAETLEFPAGTWVIPAKQPQRLLVRAFLDLDHRIDLDTLKRERKDIERDGRSRMYDATAWSLLHAFDLDAWWGTGAVDEGSAPEPLSEGGIVVDDSRTGIFYGWIVDGAADSSVTFAARAMELGLQVNCADEAFETVEGSWALGSLLVRKHENPGALVEIEATVDRAARESGTRAQRIYSGRAPGEGHDLGGRHFRLLKRPRIAVLSNSPVSTSSYGHLWHHLDVVLGVPFSILDAQSLGRADLRRYNVLVLPPGGLSSVLEPIEERLETWVRGGGTLIACDGSAAALTAGRLGLSRVTLRRNALEELDEYALAVERERAARAIEIDEELVWTGKPSAKDAPAEDDEAEEPPVKPKDGESVESHDAWLRRFSPAGVNLLTETDDEHWLSAGTGTRLPISFGGSSVYLAREPIDTVVRFRPADELRLAGLLWPEARERIADSAYLTREPFGNGQLILFAGMPAYRGYHLATGRLFANAVIYGPGLGARQPVGW